MRIAITSNAPWAATGYGVQTAELAPRLKFSGHEVAIMCNYGLGGTNLEWQGIPLFPQGIDAYSNDITPWQLKHWLNDFGDQKGFALTLYDVWVYKSPEFDEVPIASWVPIDHKGVPQGVKDWFMRTGKGKWAIAMSKFGEQELLGAGIERERVFYAPHSIGSLWQPTESTIRIDMNIPADAHLTLINSQNKGNTPARKCFAEMLQGWWNFAQNKEDAYLFLWTEIHGMANGVNLPRLMSAIGIDPARVRAVPQEHYRSGIGQANVVQAVSASDVLLMTSRGEGFGVPAIEAQACGVPVIVTDWTAQTELCGSGWLVGGQPEWDEFQTGWWKVPNINEITAALEESYRVKGIPSEASAMSEKAITFAEQYRSEKVYNDYWRPILKELEGRLPIKP